MIHGSAGSAVRVSLYACRICADRRGFFGTALAPAAVPRRPKRLFWAVGLLAPRSRERSLLAMPGGYVAGVPTTGPAGREMCFSPGSGGEAPLLRADLILRHRSGGIA
jgi:hypothetical protein